MRYQVSRNGFYLLRSLEFRHSTGWKQLFVELNAEEEIIVNILKEKTNTPIDEITYKSNFAVSKVATLLLELEFKGVVNALPGKQFQLVN